MSDILNEKVDLSALNLGSFTLSALLGAVVTFLHLRHRDAADSLDPAADAG